MNNILQKIKDCKRNQLTEQNDVDLNNEIYELDESPLKDIFKTELEKVSGNFFYCSDNVNFVLKLNNLIQKKKWNNLFTYETQIIEQLNNVNISVSSNENELLNLDVGINFCEYLVARTGSVVISSKQTAGRQLNVFAPVLIIIAYKNQLVVDIGDALKNLTTKYNNNLPSLISTITGPSRTADIEKTLILGMHGPKELYVFLIDKSNF